MSTTARLRATVAAVALSAAACEAGTTGPPAGPTTTRTSDPVASGEHRTCTPMEEFDNGDAEEAPVDESALFPWDRPDPAVLEGLDFSRVISGGPPPDGIRPIDDPCFDSIAAADEWLEPQSPVMVVELGDDESLFVDEQTGSTWNLLGEAVDGELAGTEVEAISRDDTFWFVWFAFQPDTEIVGAEAFDD